MAKIVPLTIDGGKRREAGYDWFDQWMEAYRSALQRYVQRVCPPGLDVDDIVQEVFLRVWRSAEPDAVENPRAYLMVAARNTIVDLLRKHREASSGGAAAELDNPQRKGTLDFCELTLAIERAISELPEKCRAVFMLCRYDGLSTTEISQRMKISERMVQKHLARALSHFHRNLM